MLGPLFIPRALLDAIGAHAENEYPRECCGLVLADATFPDRLICWQPCTNAQDRYHSLHPNQFPRTSATAYFIDSAELFAVTRAAEREGQLIRAIVHSHCDAAAYFSEEDEARALADGQPLYPDVDYLVVSVMNGRVGDSAAFRWTPEKGFMRREVVAIAPDSQL